MWVSYSEVGLVFGSETYMGGGARGKLGCRIMNVIYAYAINR